MNKNICKEKTEDNKEKTKESSNIMRFILELALIVIIVLLIRHFIFVPTVVKGHSMEPTLEPWDFLIENKWNIKNKEIERGMIVILDSPGDTDKEYVKRIIAIPGDKLLISNGDVFLNNQKLKEPYIDEETYYPMGDLYIEIPENEYFVMGDNRGPGGSNDSRSFGTIEKESINGIAVFRYFPFKDKFGSLKNK